MDVENDTDEEKPDRSGASTRVIARLKCLAYGHRWEPHRAIEYDPEGGCNLHKHEGDDEYTKYTIPSCRLLKRCQRCGSNSSILLTVDMLRRRYPDVETAWDPNETPPPLPEELQGKF